LNRPTTPGEKIALVQGFTLFSDLSYAACAAILAVAQEKCFWRSQTMYVQGEPVEQVMMLLSGGVKIMQHGFNGDEVILRLIVKGEIVGGFPPRAEYTHRSTAQALESSSALVWEVGAFRELLDSFPVFQSNLVRVLEARLREIEQRFLEVCCEEVASRLSHELIRLTNRLSNDLRGNNKIFLSCRELAQMIGTTRATVSRLLCRWEKLGIVSVRGEGVEVRDFAALTRLAANE